LKQSIRRRWKSWKMSVSWPEVKKRVIFTVGTAAVLPEVAMRDMRATWQEKGRPDAHTRALSKASSILSHDNPTVFSSEVDLKIRARFKNLVAGTAGWEKRDDLRICGSRS
jgi:hypothetical protein